MAAVGREKVAQYFDYPNKLKRLRQCGGIAAAALVIAFVASGTGRIGAIVVCVALALAAAYFYNAMKGCPQDQDIEDTFQQYIEGKYEAALEAVHIMKEKLIRDNDWFWFISSGINQHVRHFRQGKDGIWRSNTRSFLIVMYGEDQILSYEINHNIETGGESFSSDAEYYYKDVAGIEVSTTAMVLRTSGGEKTFPLSGNYETGDQGRAKSVMTTIRTMLREKKRT